MYATLTNEYPNSHLFLRLYLGIFGDRNIVYPYFYDLFAPIYYNKFHIHGKSKNGKLPREVCWYNNDHFDINCKIFYQE